MNQHLPTLIAIAGGLQLSVLVASALVPVRLRWKEQLTVLPRLHLQLYWVYGGYVVMSIIALGLLSLFNARELASGSGLARGVCIYITAFWGVRLCLQAVLDVKEHLTTWWLRVGYHLLTALFLYFTLVYGAAAILGASPGT